MEADRPVWYVAYGSNLLRARFEVYLHGGRFDGASRLYPGCRSRVEPSGEERVTVRHRLAFGRHSPNWGGGVAFVDPARDGRARTVGRAWRIEAGQLADLIAQENGGDHLDPDGAWAQLVPGGAHALRLGWYTTLVRCDDVEGEPAFTVTGEPWPLAPNPPTPAYAACVRAGLIETGLDADEADAYLAEHGADPAAP